jgi:hypothetical protein
LPLLYLLRRRRDRIAALPAGEAVLTASGIPVDALGVMVGEPKAVVERLAGLLALHRVWDRFTPASKATPAQAKRPRRRAA